MLRSRLNRRKEQKIKKSLILSILGTLVIIFLVFKFGIPFLVNLSFFLSNSKNKEEIKIQNQTFIAPPILDSFLSATSSADIVISGVSAKDQTVNLYINDDLVNSVKSENDGKFVFKETIKPGENTVKTKAVVNGKESDFSNTITVIFKNAPPSLSIASPSDGQSFSKDQNVAGVKGTTDPDVKVTVNDFWAIADSNGNFSYNLPLQNGENRVKIVAVDVAGNKAEKEIKVTYSP